MRKPSVSRGCCSLVAKTTEKNKYCQATAPFKHSFIVHTEYEREITTWIVCVTSGIVHSDGRLLKWRGWRGRARTPISMFGWVNSKGVELLQPWRIKGVEGGTTSATLGSLQHRRPHAWSRAWKESIFLGVEFRDYHLRSIAPWIWCARPWINNQAADVWLMADVGNRNVSSCLYHFEFKA
jgi:hypothetical protein